MRQASRNGSNSRLKSQHPPGCNPQHERSLEAHAREIPAVAQNARAQGLGESDTLIKAKVAATGRELARLKALPNPAPDRIVALERRGNLNRAWQTQVQAEYENTLVKAPDADPEAWIVYGRVVEPSGRGVPEHVVDVLLDRKRFLGQDCTDAQGRFQISLPAQGRAHQALKAKAGAAKDTGGAQAYLQVKNSKGAVRHIDDKGMQLKLGGRVARRIVLGGDAQEPCPPERPSKPRAESLRAEKMQPAERPAAALNNKQAAKKKNKR